MNSFVMFAVFALAAAAVNCEAPGGYNYNRPSTVGGVLSGGNSVFSAGGNYEEEAIGASTNEGINVDAQLLEKIKQILLQEESKSGRGNNLGTPSSQYGAPAPQYGPPQQQQARVVGIVLENTQPAIQVAQYRSQSQSAAQGYDAQGGYPSGPSNSYGPPAAPRSTYGAPRY